MKTGLMITGVIVGFVALIFIINEAEIFGTRFWGTRRESAKREVFKQNQSHVEGKAQELAKLKLEYDQSDDEATRKALKNHIVIVFADENEDDIASPELRNFLIKMRSEK